MKGVEAFDPGGRGEHEAIFSQEIEWAGQWFVRRDAGTYATEAARGRKVEAQSRRRLATMDAIPDIDLGAVAKRCLAGSDPTYGIRIALPIPLWNQGQLVESELAYWDSWLRQRNARAIAEAAVGNLPEMGGEEG